MSHLGFLALIIGLFAVIFVVADFAQRNSGPWCSVHEGRVRCPSRVRVDQRTAIVASAAVLRV